jgi:hypothetical protein
MDIVQKDINESFQKLALSNVLSDLLQQDLDLEKPTKSFGLKVDKKVYFLELAVIQYYSIDEALLKDWRYDSQAKIVICFLLFHVYGYSIGSLSDRYHIYKLRLIDRIKKIYQDLDTDPQLREELGQIIEKLLKFNCLIVD